MAKRNKDKKSEPAALFIPAGVLIGIGMGFAYDNVPAGTMIGLGAGFLVMAVIMLLRKREKGN